MVLLTDVRPKPGFGPFVVRLWVKFSKFRPVETSDLYANGPEVSLQNFLLILGTPLPKITNQSFRPSCDQMVLLTGVQPKPEFGPFVHRATISLSWYF